MNHVTAQAYMEALEKTHQRATQSKEASLKFLREAGIIPARKNKSKKAITKKLR